MHYGTIYTLVLHKFRIKGDKMRKSVTMAASIIMSIMVACICLAYYIITFNITIHEKDSHISAVNNIYNIFENEFETPLTVANTIASDFFLQQILKEENLRSKEQNEEIFKNYLNSIRNEFHYNSVDIISHSSHYYYTQDGILKHVDPNTDPSDTWITSFEGSNIPYTASVYIDPNNKDLSTVYFNKRITDENGTFLGITSTGIPLQRIINLIREIENKHKIKINFTDDTGLVLLDSFEENIVNTTVTSIFSTPDYSSYNFDYIKNNNLSFSIVHYIEKLNWFFVSTSYVNSKKISYLSFYLIALLCLVVSIYVLFTIRKCWHKVKFSYVEKPAELDKLTGLPNRNFFKDMFGERGIFNTTRYKSLAVFDIDSFKEANDTMNGDLALISVVKIVTDLVKDKGMVLRWGGDEFLILFELSMEDASRLCHEFCKQVENENLVTVSIGLTEIRLSDTIKTNYYRAAQHCYFAKEMGGNGVKRD